MLHQVYFFPLSVLILLKYILHYLWQKLYIKYNKEYVPCRYKICCSDRNCIKKEKENDTKLGKSCNKSRK